LDPTVTLTDTPDATARSVLLRGLMGFNATQVGHPEDSHLLALLLSDPATGEIIGGLWGDTLFGQLHISLLFVPETSRHAGLGRRLMGDAEAEAIRRGCAGAWLNTFSFQARGFYEKLGYTVFGTLDNQPPGYSRFFLKKTFVTPPNSPG
jgi:GNAT superfamily N-acetyltransferase